jgi:predicted Zn finger-like uncharacterized protein
MKFLCGNCKAKYQIADEKVSGRTLRMKCRRCGHDILIDGHAMASSVPPAAPSPAALARKPGATSLVPAAQGRGDPRAVTAMAGAAPRPGAQRSRPPSALGQDFRRHIAAPPEVPQRTAPYDLWHVAIQDVPVGPMTRDELARKVEAGAVTGESLCWREGMDDWRPMSELPELAQVLRRAQGESSWSGRPPPRPRRDPSVPLRSVEAELADLDVADDHSPSIVPAAPAALPAPKRVAPRPEPSLPMPTVAAAAPSREVGPALAPLPMKPAAVSQKVAVAPPSRLEKEASAPVLVQPMVEPAPVVEAPAAAPISVAQPLPAAVTAQEAPSKLNAGLTTGIAVGLLGGILLVGGPILYKNTWGSSGPTAQAPVQAAPVVAPKPAPSAREPELVLDVPEEPDVKSPEPGKLATNGPRPTAGAARNGKTDPVAKVDPNAKLSDAERKLLERMGGAGADATNLGTVARPSREDNGPSGPTLTPAQLMAVVQNNKPQLQRCYETALRASGGKQDGAIKVSVNVTVGAAGSVKGVSTDGNGMGSMNDCLRTSVKRWRFPQSGGDSEFAFPLVFQPGA